MTKILYVSSLCSEKLLDYIFKTADRKPEQAVQKFHKLLVNGFASNNSKCTIAVLSSIPVVSATHKRKIWLLPSEKTNGVKYNYVPVVNINRIKNIIVFIYTFFSVLWWCLFRLRKERVIVCDVLNISISFASVLAAKLTFTKRITIITDLPGLIVTNKTKSKKIANTSFQSIFEYMLGNFNGYVLLTQQMNSVVNKKNRPYLIMEGLVDNKMEASKNQLDLKSEEKIIIYAGGLYEKYGVKKLIDAFKKVNDPLARLHLYGTGQMTQYMDDFIGNDNRIIFKGMVPNQLVVADQLKATLLVNPRPTDEEFTKYSFPSKNMEYMVSGTPTLTTQLPGMPKEYNDYVYLFENESVEGMSKTLQIILSKSNEELHLFGHKAKEFVLRNKNNITQASRILDFCKKKIE